MTEAVVDAGPLIHLAELECLDILIDLEVLYVADVVWEEVKRHQPEVLTNSRLGLHRISVPNPSAELQVLAQALTLDQGELASLSLMETYPRSWFLTDDAAARLAAEQHAYTVHGTIGLLIRSVRTKRRTANQVLTILRSLPQRSTLHIRPGLIQAIIERLEGEWSG